MLFEIDEDEDGFFFFQIRGRDKQVLTDLKRFDKWTINMMISLKDVLKKISIDLGDEEKYLCALENYEKSI